MLESYAGFTHLLQVQLMVSFPACQMELIWVAFLILFTLHELFTVYGKSEEISCKVVLLFGVKDSISREI